MIPPLQTHTSHNQRASLLRVVRTPKSQRCRQNRWQHLLTLGIGFLWAQVVNFMFPQIVLCFYFTGQNKVFVFHYTARSHDFYTPFLISQSRGLLPLSLVLVSATLLQQSSQFLLCCDCLGLEILSVALVSSSQLTLTLTNSGSTGQLYKENSKFTFVTG